MGALERTVPIQEDGPAVQTVADVAVRIVVITADNGNEKFFRCVAAGAPVADEWCYLAHSASIDECWRLSKAVLGDEAMRACFVRSAALMGVPWQEGEMLAILTRQEAEARRLMEQAPDVAEADPEELRRIRREVDEQVADGQG